MSSNIGSYTHKVLQLPKLELNRTIDMPKWMGRRGAHEASTLPRTTGIRHVESRENSLPQRTTHHLVMQQQMVSSANIHAHNTIKTEQGVLTYLGIHMYIQTCM